MAAASLAIGSLPALAGPTLAAAPAAVFGTPTATATYDQGIVFSQPVSLAASVSSAELLITFPGAEGPFLVEVPPPSSTGPMTLRYTWSIATEGHMFPNTRLSARWRLRADDGSGSTIDGPSVSVTYADTRFQWQTQQGSIVRVHWYQGDAAFGRRALAVGEQGIKNAEGLLGVTESQPVDFYVYADQQAFYDALGPGTRENVGGEAIADIRTMFALITPSEINASWVGIVIPHELTHLVFDTAVRNPYHFPPRWLNEGLAVYLSQGYDQSDRAMVQSAAADGSLVPLDGLTGAFPTDRTGFYQAYAESVSAVDFMIRRYGQDALVKLIRSYAQGRTDDEAFTAALGVDTAGFDAAWFAELGATIPPKSGPRPAPAGPVPSGWSTVSSGSGQTGTSSPGASASSSPAGPGQGGSGSPDTVLLAILAIVVVAFVGTLLVILRMSRGARRVDATPSEPGSSDDLDR